MERIIKFRGKRVDNGEWVYGDYAKGERSHYIIQRSWVEIDPATLGQFTGLHDKNGKEIYEGDVVNMRYDEPYDRPHIIVYHRNKFMAMHLSEYGKFLQGDEIYFSNTGKFPSSFDAAVIGSIQSNPELLQQ